MNQPALDERVETTGLVITTPHDYDGRMRLHTRGRERRFRDEEVLHARLSPGERVLDVGCGTGGMSIAAARAVAPGGTVVGVDPSPEMVGQARIKARRARVDATFRTAAIERLPFPDASFDVVTLSLVLHQLGTAAFHQGLVEVRRVLRPGGRLFAVDMGGPQEAGRRTAHAPHGHGQGHGLDGTDRPDGGQPAAPPFDLDRVSMYFEHLGFEILDTGPIEFRFTDLEDLRYVLARRGEDGRGA